MAGITNVLFIIVEIRELAKPIFVASIWAYAHDEVFWLDVSVQHAVAVHALDCAAELAEHREDFVVVVGAWGLAHERAEILAIEVLHH